MAYFNKVGLLILSESDTKFLVCQKKTLKEFILPGGKIELGESDVQCLCREIKEELDVDIIQDTLKYIGEYIDIAAGSIDKDVSIKLYLGEISGIIKPSNEILDVFWISKDDALSKNLSNIIKNKILPDLLKKNILK